MILIADKQTLARHAEELGAFEKIYNDGFPDVNECENFEDICTRIAGGQPQGQPSSLMVLCRGGDQGRIAGGIIADWYDSSKALHLTYLVVDPHVRRQGAGKKLINDGSRLMIEWIGAERGVGIQNVFFESNNPLIASDDNFDKNLRLRIFSHLGAKLINIPYVQPPLEEGKQAVDNLLLFCFTQFSADPETLPARQVVHFLEDFYRGLGCGTDDAALESMRRALKSGEDDEGDILLEEMPERSACRFEQASVTIHYIDQASRHAPVDAPGAEERCKYFFSFETDLLNYHNQKKRPFFTCWREWITRAQLILPPSYSYTSEGLSHTRLTERERIAVEVSVSESTICGTGRRIAHLTLKPARGGWFTELEIIKLATLFGSTQEGVNRGGVMLLSLDSEPAIEFEQVLERYCADGKHSYKCLETGIVQLDMSGTQTESTEEGQICSCLSKAMRDKTGSAMNPDYGAGKFAKTLCGITLGIFDFERMNEEEIRDTIIPIVVHPYSFVVASRGNIVKISDEECFSEIPANIVVSPYILVPSMLLAYNEYVLNSAARLLDTSIRQGLNADEMDSNMIRTRDMLNADYLVDVFQYPSEKEIVQYGNGQRGITNAYEQVTRRMVVLKEMIDRKRYNKSNLSDSMLSTILFFIALLQLRGLFLSEFKFNIYYLIILVPTAFIFYVLRSKRSKNR